MLTEFKKGDVVVLKSGGPAMTLDYKTHDGKWTCRWFDKEHSPHVGYYFPDSFEYPKDSEVQDKG